MKTEQRERVNAITKRLNELLSDEWQVVERIREYPHGQIYVGWVFSCGDFWTGGSMFEIGILANGYESDDGFCQDIASGVLDVKKRRALADAHLEVAQCQKQ